MDEDSGDPHPAWTTAEAEAEAAGVSGGVGGGVGGGARQMAPQPPYQRSVELEMDDDSLSIAMEEVR